ncbi:hypothetical protein NSP_26270 [Nodularia spumigena CCY9414]|nr:hypothetical protein NSP_26270 [Nodularia spumigena CCY9414]
MAGRFSSNEHLVTFINKCSPQSGVRELALGAFSSSRE